MGKSRDRATRSGSDPVNIGTTRLSIDSGNIKVTAQDGTTFKKIFAEEVRVGSGNDQVIFKRGSDGKAEFQSTSDGGSSTSNLTVGGSSTVTNPSDLPISGNTAGDTILVTSTNNLMIYNGSGWYKIATITNANPTISSAGSSTYSFATDGTPVTIEIVASDPEGVSLQYKYQVTTGSIGNTATVTNSATSGGTYSALAANTYSNNRFFKVTPSTNDAHAGTFALTFSVTDGVNTANSTVSSFTLGFNVSGSLVFDGTGDYIEFPSQYNLGQASADWTVEFWAWFYDFGQSAGNSNANCILIGKNDNGIAIEGYNWHGISPGTGKIRLVRNNTGNVVLTSNTLLVPKTWYHIAVTNTGSSNTQKLYINGVQDSATGSYASAFTFSDAKTIVGGTWWSSQLKLPFRGYLSNVRTVAGSVYSPSAQSGGSTVFDGTGDYLLTAEDSELVLGTGDFTVEHWIYMSSTSVGQVIEYRKQGAGYNTGDWATYTTSGNYKFFMGSDRLSTGAVLSQTKWYHIAIVRYNGVTTLYVDGKLSSDLGGGGTATYADTNNYTSNQVTIGIHGNDRSTYPFNGKISNVRITIGTALYTDRFTRPQRPFTKVTNTQLLTCQNDSFAVTDASDNNVTITAGGDAAANSAHPFETAGNDYNTGSAFTVPTSALTAVSNTKLLTGIEAEPLATIGSITFDGTGDYVSGVVTAAGSSDFTLECWFNFDATGHKGIVHIGDNAWGSNGNGIGFAIKPSIGGYQIYYNDTYTNTSNQGSIPNTGVWHHGAMVRTGGTTKLYIDGVETISVSDSKNYASTHIMIGGFYSASQVMDGKISDLRYVVGTAVYTGAFTPPTGRLTLTGGTYSSTTNVNTSIPSGHTKLLTANELAINDDSASSVSLTAVADAAAVADMPFQFTKDSSSINATPTSYGDASHDYPSPFAQGVGGSTRFDGTGDWCAITSSGDLQIAGSNFTVEFWVYLPVAISADYKVFVGKGWNSDNTREWYFEGMSDQKLDFYWSTNGSSWSSAEATSALETNRWYHIVAQRTGSTLKIFTDGVETYVNNSFPTIHSGTGVFNIGGYNDGSAGLYSNSYISNVRLVKGSNVYTYGGPTLGSIDVDGTGDWVTGTVAAAGTNDFTLEAWVNWDTVSHSGVVSIHTALNAGAVNGIAIAKPSGTGWQIYHSNTYSNAGSSPVAGNWYHVAMVRISGTTKLYVNGVQTISQSDTTNYTQTILKIGGYYSTGYLMDGKISDVRWVVGTGVYTGAFTPPTGRLTLTGGTYSSTTNVNTSIPSGHTKLLTANESSAINDDSTSSVSLTAAGDAAATSDTPFGSTLSVPTAQLTAVSNTKLLTCNDSNVINDGSASNKSIKAHGETVATRFNPF